MLNSKLVEYIFNTPPSRLLYVIQFYCCICADKPDDLIACDNFVEYGSPVVAYVGEK